MPHAWRTVKVFISSTFKDMQAERDHLVRFVFPRLRDELLKQRIHLVDVDLRWGVTSDQDALSVCREIIDECRPRFLCILGDRYGWTPPGGEESITAQEVHYALCHRQDVDDEYRFFYFRDPQVTAGIPENAARAWGYREFPTLADEADYGREAAEVRARQRSEKLDALKREVVEAGYAPFIYPARWDETQQRLVDLKSFGDKVYEDLLESVRHEFCHRFEVPLEKMDEFVAENSAMEAFVRERPTGYVVGSRQGLLRELQVFAQRNGPPNVLVVTGPPGSGKSALLARFYLDCVGSKEESLPSRALVIPHFIGASPGSTDLRLTLRRFCHELAQATELEEEIPQEPQELLCKFPDLLKRAAARRRVVLLIDALNQMNAGNNADLIHWLPHDLPPKIRIIVSSLEHPTLEVLLGRGKEQVREEKLSPLETEDRLAIITGFLNRYGKRLSMEQIRGLLGKADSEIPLYLITSLEELRTLGSYEEITRRIQELPPRAPELFRWILRRLEDDPGFQDPEGVPVGRELAHGFASLLGVSRYGLSQMELAELMAPGAPWAAPPIPHDPQGNVAAMLRLLRPYLMHRGELVDFYHGQFRAAAEATCLSQEEARMAAHRRLYDYFKRKADPRGNSSWSGGYPRALAELPYHQLNAQMSSGYFETLTCFNFLKAKINALGIYSLITDYQLTSSTCGYKIIGEYKHKVDLLRLIEETLRLSAYILCQNPDQLAGQCIGRLLRSSIPSVTNFLDQIRKNKKGAWLRPLNAGLYPPDSPLIQTLNVREFDTYIGDNIAFTPDGSKLIVPSDQNTLTVWDVKTGRELNHMTGHTDKICSVVISPDGQTLFSGSSDRTVRSWNLETGEELWSHEMDSAVNKVVLSYQGRRLVAQLRNGTIKVMDRKTRQEAFAFELSGNDVKSLTITPDGRKVVCGFRSETSGEETLRIWNLETGGKLNLRAGKHPDLAIRGITVTPDFQNVIWTSEKDIKVWNLTTDDEPYTLSGHPSEVTALVVIRDGRWLISACDGCYLKVWDLERRELLRTFFPVGVRSFGITSEGKKLIGVGRGGVSTWDLEVIQDLQTKHYSSFSQELGNEYLPELYHLGEELNDSLMCLAITPDNGRVISGSLNGKIYVWDLYAALELLDQIERPGAKTLISDGNPVKLLVVSPDGKRLISTSSTFLSSSASITVWDLESLQELYSIPIQQEEILAMTISPDCRRLIAGFKFGPVKIWDMDTGQELGSSSNKSRYPLGMAFTPDAKIVISILPEAVEVWELETSRQLGSLAGCDINIGHVAVTSDSRKMVTTSQKGIFKILDLQNGREIRTINTERRPSSVTLDAKDERILFHTGSRYDSSTTLVDIKTGQEIQTLPGVKPIAVTPDCKTLASASEKNAIKIWKLGQESRTLLAHASSITSLAATPCGRKLVSGSSDGMMKVWDLKTCREIFTMNNHSKNVLSITVTPDSSKIIVGMLSSLITIIDINSGKKLGDLKTSNKYFKDSAIAVVSVTPDGNKLLSANMIGILNIWDLRTGLELYTSERAQKAIRAIVISSNGRLAYLGGWADGLIVRDVESGKELRKLKGYSDSDYVSTLAAMPDGSAVFSGGNNGVVEVWDAESGAKINRFFKGSKFFQNSRIAITPDGRRAVSDSRDGFLNLWNLSSRRVVARFKGDSELRSWIVTPDGQNIITGGETGEIHFLHVEGVVQHPIVVTAWRSEQEESAAFGCPCCSLWSEVPETALGTELLCPRCSKKLKLNAFTIKADWRPVAQAWAEVG